MSKKICIVGCGSIGLYFGGLLAKSGADVTFFTRGEQLKVLQEKGLTLNRAGEQYVFEVTATDEVTDIAAAEIVLICVKTYSTIEMCELIKNSVGDGATVISIQNGVDNEKVIAEIVSQAHVYPGNAWIVSRRDEPGVVTYKGGIQKLVFGDPEHTDNEVLRWFAQACKDADIDVQLSDNIQSDIWNKFCLITAFGGLTAYYRANIAETVEGHREEYEACVKETIALADAKGVTLPDDIFAIVMKRTMNYLDTPEKRISKSSLLVDLESGLKTEIEGINGYVVREGKRLGVDVPVNTMIYEKVVGESA